MPAWMSVTLLVTHLEHQSLRLCPSFLLFRLLMDAALGA